jgi:TRAP-type C4-dicarboxylate transport system permease small subunit
MDTIKEVVKHVLDIAIMAYLLFSIGYAGWQVFSLAPEGVSGALFGAAQDIDPNLMQARRLYAIETYILIIAFLIYKINRKRFWEFDNI